MSLLGALAEHESALRASLQAEYGMRLLHGGRTEPERTPRELGDLVAHLPPGCALWRATGGDIAWSDETQLLAMVEHGVRVLGWMKTKDGSEGRNRPERVNPPKRAHDEQAKKAKASAKADAWERRQRRHERSAIAD